MKKLLLLLFSIFFLSSPSVFADDIDLYELSIKYPQCQNSTYRDECFDDFSFGKDRINRDAGYFRDNLMWEGLFWSNDVLTQRFNTNLGQCLESQNFQMKGRDG